MALELDAPAALLLLLCLVALNAWNTRRSRPLPTPPGPRGIPFIGNAHQLPLQGQEIAFSRWAKKLGMCLIL